MSSVLPRYQYMFLQKVSQNALVFQKNDDLVKGDGKDGFHLSKELWKILKDHKIKLNFLTFMKHLEMYQK